ncbi:STAS domain-containing protein [Nocardia sp. NPDC059239]|uniref:STAS domain-containing protein n=1 Tax=unclassified Nocardia TaxID=2637762 RepID=UPI0036B9E24D
MSSSFMVAAGSTPAQRCGPPTQLGITHSRPSPSTTVLTATGEIDYCTVGAFREHLTEAIDTSGRLVVVDLSRITFLSISGLLAVLDADDAAHRHHIRLRVVTGPRCVDRLFEVFGQATDLAITHTIAAACTPGPRALAPARTLP